MIRSRHAAGLLVALCGLVLSGGCRTTTTPTPDLPLDAAALVAEATKLAQEAVVARQTAVLALDNALAAQDKAEAKLRTAFQEQGLPEITAAKTNLVSATAEARRTLKAADQVVTLALEVARATGSVRGPADDLSDAALGNLRQTVLSCRKMIATAKGIADELKREWLVADLSGKPEEKETEAE